MSTTPTQSEPRAGQALASTTNPFVSRAGRSVGTFSSSLVQRWAPDDGGIGARPGGGLRSLGLVDRLLAPYVRQAQSGPGLLLGRSEPRRERASDEPESGKSSWLFPTPWYLDELDWEQAELIAGGPQRRAAPRRLWSPTMSTPAAKAAEVLAAVRQGARVSPSESALVPDFTFVTPATLGSYMAAADQERAVPARRAVSSSFGPAPATGTPAAPLGTRTISSAPPSVAPVETTPLPSASSTTGQGQASASPEPVFVAPTPAAPTDVGAPSVSAPTPAARFDSFVPPVSEPSVDELPSAAPASLSAAALAPAAGPHVELSVGLAGLVSAIGQEQRHRQPIGWSTPVPEDRLEATMASPIAAPRFEEPEPAAMTLVTSGYRNAEAPRSLAHLSWTDRWLGRFAGASTEALGDLGTSRGWSAFERATPDDLGSWLHSVVLPLEPGTAMETAPQRSVSAQAQVAQPVIGREHPAPVSTLNAPSAPEPAAQSTTADSASTGVPIIGDDEVTSPEMFAKIAAAAAADRRRRGAAPSAPAPRPEPATTAAPAFAAPAVVRSVGPSAAETLMAEAHRTWQEPGLRPALASSPAAPALRSTLGIEPAPAFDVRGLAARAPLAWYREVVSRSVVSPVARPSLEHVSAQRAPSLGWVMGEMLRPSQVMARTAPVFTSPRAFTERRTALAAEATVGPGIGARPVARELVTPSVLTPTTPARVEREPLRSAPAHELPFVSLADGPPVRSSSFPSMGTRGTAAAPAAARSPDRGRPGALVADALGFSGARAQAAEGLARDFIAPELVMAARTYGFGPAEAVAAARLASGGPDVIRSVASAVDFGFVQLAIESERGRARAGHAAAQPSRRGPSTALAPSHTQATATPSAPVVVAATAVPAQVSSIRRGLPRGSFLWPATSARALGMRALDSDRQLPYSRAALDVMAAATVLELGSEASVGEWSVAPSAGAATMATTVPPSAVPGLAGPVPMGAMSPRPTPDALPTADAAMPLVGPAVRSRSARAPSAAPASTTTVSEAAARAMATPAASAPPRSSSAVPGFDLAWLEASAEPMPVVVRAARALAASSSGDAAPTTPRARAREALARMPEAAIANAPAAARAPGGRQESATADPSMTLLAPGPAAGARIPPTQARGMVDAAPSMAALVSRVAHAGESLQSLVAPMVHGAPSASPSFAPSPFAQSSPSSQPLGNRREAPKAELVSPAATSRRHKAVTEAVLRASGVQSLPPWFEDAAKRLLAGDGDEMSFAELVLVSTAAPGAMAADEKSASSGGTAAQADAVAGIGTGESYGAPPAPDVEVLAREVYELILSMLDIARDRVGDPWEGI